MAKHLNILSLLLLCIISFTMSGSASNEIIKASNDISFSEYNDSTLIYDKDGNSVMKYTLSFSADGGTITGNPGLYSPGETIDITAVPDDGYVFTGWSSSSGGVFSDKNSAATTYRIPPRSVTITANFALKPPPAPVLSVLGDDVSYEFDTLVSKGFSTHLVTEGNPTLSVEGDKLKIERTNAAHSVRFKLGTLEKGRRYIVTFTMSYESGKTGNLRIFTQPYNGNQIITAAFNGTPVNASIEFDYTDEFINTNTGRTTIQASASAYNDTSTIYIHAITVEDKGPVAGYTDNTPQKNLVYSSENPSLYARYKDNFIIGAALNDNIVNETASSGSVYNNIIDQNFTSLTAENSMKPDSILNQSKSKANLTVSDPEMKGMPGINTSHIDRNLKYAIDHGLKVRYHVLIWHSQMPAWFFDVNYEQQRKSDDSGGYKVINEISKEVLLQRMESYIKQVFDYINTAKHNGVYYKDVIYTYDVVNEAMTTAAKNFYFYKIFNGKAGSNEFAIDGDIEYISYSFLFARKYADPEATLIYNDYGCYWPGKRNAIHDMVKAVNNPNNPVNTIGGKLIDGVGMQMHIGIASPRTTGADTAAWDGGSIENAILKFASLGVEVQITELDVSGNESATNLNEAAAATRYKNVMKLLYDLDSNSSNGVDITSVSVWGISDKDSWILNNYCSYPLLFGSDLSANDAYYAVLLDDNVKK